MAEIDAPNQHKLVSTEPCIAEHCTDRDEGTHVLSKVPIDAGPRHKHSVRGEYVAEHCIQLQGAYLLPMAEIDAPK